MTGITMNKTLPLRCNYNGKHLIFMMAFNQSKGCLANEDGWSGYCADNIAPSVCVWE